MLHPAVGLLVLVFIAVLNIYKPRGPTGFGERARSGRPRPANKSSKV